MAVLIVHLVPLFKLCGGANLAFATVAANRNMAKMIKWVSIAQNATNYTENDGQRCQNSEFFFSPFFWPLFGSGEGVLSPTLLRTKTGLVPKPSENIVSIELEFLPLFIQSFRCR